ncbi:MAG: hypothetical protein HUU20_22420, partial [Pirellulales bacterium]|nr:hypothetical protein [Pirellulales bacterium]
APSAELVLRPETTLSIGATPPAEAARDVRLDSQVPSLRVAAAGPDTVIVGKPATYLVTLANQGEFAARKITVQVALPAWLNLEASKATAGIVRRENLAAGGQLIWDIDEVGGQKEDALSLTLVPQEGRGFDLALDWSVRPPASTTPITVKEPKLKLEIAGTDDVVFGGTAANTITVSNPGTGDAHAVSLKVYSDADELGNLEVGTVPAGAQRTVDLNFRPAKVGAGTLRAVAAGERGLEAASTRAYQVRRAALHVQLEGSMFEFAGSEAAYVVRVANTGDADAENVMVTLSLPGGTKYLSGLEAATATSSGIAWTIDRVGPGAERVFTVICELSGAGELQFAARASTPDHLVATGAVVTRVQSAADLKLEVLDPKGPRAVEEDVSYEIHVSNRGTAEARQISIVAVCSPEVETIDVTGNAAVKSGQVFFRPVAELKPQGKIVQKVTVRAHKPGNHVFRVIVQCDDPETRLASDETTRFFVRPEGQALLAPGIETR